MKEDCAQHVGYDVSLGVDGVEDLLAINESTGCPGGGVDHLGFE